MNFLPSHVWTVQKFSMHSFIVLVANSELPFGPS
jgi:hypothetical protein